VKWLYHVGKIVKVFSPNNNEIDSADDSTQAMIMMWDENLLTLKVAEKLGKKVREGDIVLVDYRPLSDKIPAPRMMVVKILHGDIAEKTWREYKEYYELMKKKRAGPPTTPQPQVPGYR
jgi:translation initiation factor IF-1